MKLQYICSNFPTLYFKDTFSCIVKLHCVLVINFHYIYCKITIEIFNSAGLRSSFCFELVNGRAFYTYENIVISLTPWTKQVTWKNYILIQSCKITFFVYTIFCSKFGKCTISDFDLNKKYFCLRPCPRWATWPSNQLFFAHITFFVMKIAF